MVLEKTININILTN